MTKSIFEKSYMIRSQAEKAAAKEFGADWGQHYELVLSECGKKWQLAKLDETEAGEKTNLTLAEALEESGERLEDLKDPDQARADALANASMGTDPLKPRFSVCEKPTKKVWHIADSMPKASRKEVMAECVAQGIAYGTARTQYQAWFKASQECERMEVRKPYEKGE